MSSPDPRPGAVIVAAGEGRRFGGAVAKQFREIDGVPILLRAVRAFADHPAIGSIVVVLPLADVASPPAWLTALGVRTVAGGAQRNDSVRCGLAALPPYADPVLIHDGARPLISADVIGRVIEAAQTGTGAVPAIPATDTLKEVDGDGRVVRTVDRARIWHAQTPQGFPRTMIDRVHQLAHEADFTGTDDASLCEHFGEPVRIVDGSSENLKVTRPADLVVAGALAHLFE